MRSPTLPLLNLAKRDEEIVSLQKQLADLDIVALDGASFIAKHDKPGISAPATAGNY
jgi:hypothetical protein